MKCRSMIPAFLALALLAGCASAQPPKPDPLKADVIILQKQLLELQKVQNETKARLDESTTALAALSGKLHAMEERQAARVLAQASQDSMQKAAPGKKSPSQKKTAKKAKKKVRRQE